MKSVTIGELANALNDVKADGTAKSVTSVAGTTSTSTFLSLDTPPSLTGSRADTEGALKNLIALLVTAKVITDATTT